MSDISMKTTIIESCCWLRMPTLIWGNVTIEDILQSLVSS